MGWYNPLDELKKKLSINFQECMMLSYKLSIDFPSFSPSNRSYGDITDVPNSRNIDERKNKGAGS